MQYRGVANRDVVANRERIAIREVGAFMRDMTHHKVLNIRAIANSNRVHIPADDGIGPNRAVIPDGDIPDDLRAWVDKDMRADSGKRIEILGKWHREILSSRGIPIGVI
jgi:hypothetical protein